VSFLALGILLTRTITKSSLGSAVLTRPLPCGMEESSLRPSAHVKCSHPMVSPLAANPRTALKYAESGALLVTLGSAGTATSSAPIRAFLRDRRRDMGAEPPEHGLDLENLAVVSGAAKLSFPSRYELWAYGDQQCPCDPDLDAVAASSSFPAALSEPGGCRMGAHSTPLGESRSAALGRPASSALLSTPPGALLRAASQELLSRRSSRSALSPHAFSPTCCVSAPAYLHPPAFAESPSFAIDSRLKGRQGAT
jgi:hypothetical protein